MKIREYLLKIIISYVTFLSSIFADVYDISKAFKVKFKLKSGCLNMYLLSQNYITLSLLAAFLISFFSCKYVIRFANKFFRAKSVNVGSGLFFAPIIMLLFMPIMMTEFGKYKESLCLSFIMFGSAAAMLVGFLDDKAYFTDKARLITYLVLTSVPVFLLPQVFPAIPYILEKIILVLAWTGFIKLYNYMYQQDGYIILQALATSFLLSMVIPLFAPLYLTIALVMLGFLRVSLPISNTKIPTGNIGVTFLSYLLGGLMLVSLTIDAMIISALFAVIIALSVIILYARHKLLTK